MTVLPVLAEHDAVFHCVIVLNFLGPCQPIKLSAAGTTLSFDQSEAQLLGPLGPLSLPHTKPPIMPYFSHGTSVLFIFLRKQTIH